MTRRQPTRSHMHQRRERAPKATAWAFAQKRPRVNPLSSPRWVCATEEMVVLVYAMLYVHGIQPEIRNPGTATSTATPPLLCIKSLSWPSLHSMSPICENAQSSLNASGPDTLSSPCQFHQLMWMPHTLWQIQMILMWRGTMTTSGFVALPPVKKLRNEAVVHLCSHPTKVLLVPVPLPLSPHHQLKLLWPWCD